MSPRPRVHMVGRDGIGWALDTEFALARAALSTFADIVEDPDDADVLHTVWPESTYLPFDIEEGFGGLPAVAPLNNDPFHVARQPGFIDFARRHYMLVAQSTLARERFAALGLGNVPYVPIIADLESYRPLPREDAALQRFAETHGIPRDRYVIGLFQRDSEGADITRFKAQKAPDVFLAVVLQVVRQVGKERIHVLIGGPRRHWLRGELRKHGIPFTFVGKELPGEDNLVNILDKPTMNLLYNLIDLYVVPTRWEGAPRQVFDVAACERKIVSMRVGAAADVLDPSCVCDGVLDMVARIVDDIRSDSLARTVPVHAARVRERHSVAAVAPAWQAVYASIARSPRPALPARTLAPLRKRRFLARATARLRRILAPLRTPARPRVQLVEAHASSLFAMGAPVRSALEARARLVSTRASRAVVDAAAPEAPAWLHARDASLRAAIVRMPSTPAAWETFAAPLREDARLIAAFPDGPTLGAFTARHGAPARALVLPPCFSPAAPGSGGTAALAPGLDAAALGHPAGALLPGTPAAPASVPELAARLKSSRVLGVDRQAPSELVHLALACGVPVVHDKSMAWEAAAVTARLSYHDIKELPDLMQIAIANRDTLVSVIAPARADEIADAILLALDVRP